MQYLEIASSATFKLKDKAGYLQGITVNAPGTTWTIQVFDNVTNAAPAIAGGTAFTCPAAGSVLRYDCHFSTGLTIVTSGTAGSITVSYY